MICEQQSQIEWISSGNSPGELTRSDVLGAVPSAKSVRALPPKRRSLMAEDSDVAAATFCCGCSMAYAVPRAVSRPLVTARASVVLRRRKVNSGTSVPPAAGLDILGIVIAVVE